MQNLSIRQILGLLFIVPILCVSVSLWQLAPISLGKMRDAKSLDQSILLARETGALIHRLQIERGASSGFLAGSAGDTEARTRLTKAREATDEARKNFEATIAEATASGTLPAQMRDYLDTLSARMREQVALRSKIDAQEIRAPQAITFYSTFIAELIDNGTRGTEVSAKETVANLRQAQKSLIEAKESAGIQRATGNALLSSGKPDPVVGERFVSVVATQRAALHHFRVSLGEAGKTLFDKHVAQDLQKEHSEAEAAVLSAMRAGSVADLRVADWWKLTTDRINGMYALEQALSERLRMAAAQEGAEARNQLVLTLALQALTVGLGLALTAWIGALLSKPIRRAARALERAATGDATVQAPPAMTGKGEIALISNAVGTFIAANTERARLIAEREEVEKTMGETRTRVLARMETEFNSASKSATDTLQEAASTLNTKSALMLSTVGAVRQAQDEAYAAADSSRNTVNEVTRLSEELAQSIAEIAQQSTRTAHLASEVQTRANASREAASQFEDVAQAIGSIVDLINAIAGQTNLLALNATIEAARAGDMGKGFAVVAGEVKDLAARTMDATRTIEGKVSELKGIARTAAEQATALSDDVGNIQGLNSAIAAAVHEQHMTSEGFTGSIQSLAGAVNAVVEQVDTIARLGSEAHTSASAVQDVASEMEATTATLAETLPRLISETSRRIAG